MRSPIISVLFIIILSTSLPTVTATTTENISVTFSSTPASMCWNESCWIVVESGVLDQINVSLDGGTSTTICESCLLAMYHVEGTNGTHTLTVNTTTDGVILKLQIVNTTYYDFPFALQDKTIEGGESMQTNILLLLMAFGFTLLIVGYKEKEPVSRVLMSLLGCVLFGALAMWTFDLSEFSGGATLTYTVGGLKALFVGCFMVMLINVLYSLFYATGDTVNP